MYYIVVPVVFRAILYLSVYMLNAGVDPGILYSGRRLSNLRFRDKNTVETFWREIPFPRVAIACYNHILLASVSLALAMYMNSISTHSHLVLCNKDSAWVWVLTTAPQASWYGLIVCMPETEHLASALHAREWTVSFSRANRECTWRQKQDTSICFFIPVSIFYILDKISWYW